MALNPASYNPGHTHLPHTFFLTLTHISAGGVKTGPVTEPPPPTSSETTAALLGASQDDPMGQHEGGQDKEGEGALEELVKEKEKEREHGGGGKD